MNKTIEQINSLDELIQYYESIPEDKWCKGKYREVNMFGPTGACCALGHLDIDCCIGEHEKRRNLEKKYLDLKHIIWCNQMMVIYILVEEITQSKEY